MSDLKNSWKSTGADLGGAFRNLGKTLINSGKKGVDMAVEWAEREDDPNAQTAEYVNTTAEEVSADKTEEVVSVAEEIRRLAELRDQGILTNEEFNAKKKQLLGL